jgi:putative tryptophan/tyrosine transport system permease protein
MSLSLWSGAITQGLAYAFLAWGIYLSFRVLNFADITVDGSLALGGVVTASLIVAGVSPGLAMGVAMIAGAIAGVVTGLIHTQLLINDLLSGILTSTALYSINLRVMGRSNISLFNVPSLITPLQNRGLDENWSFLIVFLCLVVVTKLLLDWFLATDLGMALRATGDNPIMLGAQGVDVRQMKVLGLAISNGLVALSGALIVQQQGFADVNMGIGSLILGLAAVIVGESIMGHRRSMPLMVGAVVLGSILFRLLIALALQMGLNPIDLKLATAVFLLLALALTRLQVWRPRRMIP